MDFISIKKLKFYTKEAFKFFNLSLIASGFVIAIVLIKYKPMYEVKISGEEVGYINNKETFNEVIEETIENYNNKNINEVNLTEAPEYELKLVERTKESNESDIIVALQKSVEITYKYYAICKDEQIIDTVDTFEVAEQVVNQIKEEIDGDTILTINEKTTKNIEELNTNSLELAKNNIIEKLDLNKQIANIEGIKIANLPITGIISSRYGESSSLRSSIHTGLDIAAPYGTAIKVVASGIVTFAGTNGSYGNLVKIDHGNGVETWYAHASTLYVTVGQEVKAGDTIAAVGLTGNTTGAHLHFEIRINGEHVNPQRYLYN